MAANDISYDFLQDLTATVLKFNVVITKLDAVSTTVDNNDVFTVASKVNNQFASKNVTYKKFLDTTQEQIRKTPTATIIGKWTFGNKQDPSTGNISNLLLLETNAIRNAAANNDLNCAVNLEYFKESSLQAIYDLSNYIYRDPHVPSHVGEIVYSYNLTSTDDMKRIYGTHTTWERIGDRYILGQGTPEENTIEKYGIIQSNDIDYISGNTGGEIEVELNANNGFPSHTHPFKAETAHFKFSWRFGTGMTSEAVEAGHTWLKADGIIKQRHASRYFCHTHFQCKKAGAALSGATISGECTISTSHNLAHGTGISPKVYTEGGAEVSSTAKHNNMPPSIILYCWRRIR